MRGKYWIKTTALSFASAVFLFFSGFLWGFWIKTPVFASATPFGWEKMSSYTTYYNVEDKDRCQNIAIAAELIDGTTLQPYGEFSFNKTVGRRTAEAGFRQAKIIVNGEYVLGVGGGVCQVSTTLYNAALLAGLWVEEYHAHSLAVSYVSPSRDAMVSSESDLKLFNPHPFPVRLSVQATKTSVTAAVYGKNTGETFRIESEITGEIAAGEPMEKWGEKEGILRYERKGTRSVSYLSRYKNGALIERKKLREDAYAPIRAIIGKKIPLPTKKML